eukprot:Gb_07288 [translate_table: standard]
MFCYSQPCKPNTCTSTRRLIHLSIHKGALAFTLLIPKLNNTTLHHFPVQIIAFSSSFTHTSKDGKPTMGLGNIIDQLHNKHGFPNTSSTKQPNLSSTLIWCKKVHNLNSRYEDFLLCSLLYKRWSLTMNWQEVISLYFAPLINRFSNHIHDTTKRSPTNRNRDGRSRVQNLLTTNKPFCSIHSNSPHRIFSQMLGNLENETNGIV